MGDAMDLSDIETWKNGMWLVASAPHIVIPLIVLVGLIVWWSRGYLEKAKHNGLTATIQGREAQITVLEERLRLAQDQVTITGNRLEVAQVEAATLRSQIGARSDLVGLLATSSSAVNAIIQSSTSNTAITEILAIPHHGGSRRGGGS